jgi:hypothetical protein
MRLHFMLAHYYQPGLRSPTAYASAGFTRCPPFPGSALRTLKATCTCVPTTRRAVRLKRAGPYTAPPMAARPLMDELKERYKSNLKCSERRVPKLSRS